MTSFLPITTSMSFFSVIDVELDSKFEASDLHQVCGQQNGFSCEVKSRAKTLPRKETSTKKKIKCQLFQQHFYTKFAFATQNSPKKTKMAATNSVPDQQLNNMSSPEMMADSSEIIVTANNTGARPKTYSNVIVDDSPLLLEKNKEGK